MAHKIDTTAARAKLAKEFKEGRRAPFWHKVRMNHFVGWRYMTPGTPGNWIAKVKAGRKETFEPLGTLADVDGADRFNTAKAMADKWFARLGATSGGAAHVSAKRVTLEQALQEYVIELRKRPKNGDHGAAEVQARFEAVVTPWEFEGKAWVDLPLSKITRRHFEAWRDYAVNLPHARDPKKKRSLRTVDREMVSLRAACNLAAERHGLPTDAWGKALKKFKFAEADTGEGGVFISPEDRAKLFDAMAEHAPDMVPFAQMQLIVPIRPGALAYAKVRHYEGHSESLFVERDKAGEGRRVTLPHDAATRAIMDEATKGKKPGANLFTDKAGKEWTSKTWGAAMRKVREAAGLPGVTIYDLRHTRISEIINGGMSVAAVAKLSGTSIAMIEASYFHLIEKTTREQLAAHSVPVPVLRAA